MRRRAQLGRFENASKAAKADQFKAEKRKEGSNTKTGPKRVAVVLEHWQPVLLRSLVIAAIFLALWSLVFPYLPREQDARDGLVSAEDILAAFERDAAEMEEKVQVRGGDVASAGGDADTVGAGKPRLRSAEDVRRDLERARGGGNAA
jgi:hypothetical protein